MEIRTLGKTGLAVSALGFGCGSVGGLLVRGEYKDISKPEVSTALVGVSNLDQLNTAITAANKGPLPADSIRALLDH
jgi:aryl-alcohol dehydrogenase-like predicted oxidoreductase